MNSMAVDVDGVYRQSYGVLDVHEVMLRDNVRTGAYAQFISDNQELFVNKVVVDVGAGTGVLSLFAAKAGARQVYAIEAAEISQMCNLLVAHNDLDSRITVLHGRVEDISLPDGVKADIIISEWMGFYLLHESMLASVIIARDKFLAPNGIMVPSAASMYVCPVSMKQYHEKNVTQWNNFYGFNFSAFANASHQLRMTQPYITTVPAAECLAEPHLIARLDLHFVGVEELSRIVSSPTFRIMKNDVLRGFACWFDVEFDGPQKPLMMSTAPGLPDTHWAQTVILLPDALLVSKEEEVQCNILLSRDVENPRRYNITVELPEDEDEVEGAAAAINGHAAALDEMMDGDDNVIYTEDMSAIIRNSMNRQT